MILRLRLRLDLVLIEEVQDFCVEIGHILTERFL
jgi:hypothetical protein